MQFRGRAWRLGDNIDTDVMTPGSILQLGAKKIAEQVLKTVRPDLAPNFKQGDIILAGRNFGCGSSREQAPQAIKDLGTSVVVAVSFARIFYRNALAIGLPVAILEGGAGAADVVRDQEEVSVDLAAAKMIHTASGTQIALRSTSPEVITLLERGGIVPLIKEIARSAQ